MNTQGSDPKVVDLEVLSPLPMTANSPVESPQFSASSSSNSSFLEMSIEGSCVSSEAEDDDQTVARSPETTTSMVLAGCPRCLMYVMLSEVDPKCPRCKSTVLLDFFSHEENTKKHHTHTTQQT